MSALYSEVILDHFRHPRNYGSLASPDTAFEDVNPICGDRIRIELEVRSGVIQAARFTGDGCAISIAAASILTEMIVGSEAQAGDLIVEDQLLSSLKGTIKRTRLNCALLPLRVFRSAISKYVARL